MKYLLFFSIILFASCQKKSIPVIEPTNPCEPYQECDTMVVWKIAHKQDTFAHGHHSALGCVLLEGGRLLYSLEVAGGTLEIIRLVDVSTQELIWEWQDYIPGTSADFMHFEIIEDNLYLDSHHEFYCIDLNTGQTKWKNAQAYPIGDGKSSHFGSKVYRVQRYGGNWAYTDSTELFEADISDGIWSPIFKTRRIEGADSFSSDLALPSLYIDEMGDTIMVFQDRKGRAGVQPWHYTILYAYNKTKQEVIWKKENLAPNDVSSIVNPPVIDKAGNRVFFLTRFTVFCFNLETGEAIWEVPLDYAGVVSGNYFLADNKLITKSDQGYLIGFDADTGSRLYFTQMGGCCTENVKAVGNRLYMTDNDLYIANLQTGKLTWRFGGWGRFSGQVAVDEENELMYAFSSYYLYAMKKPPY